MYDCECAHARKTRTSSVFARLTAHVTAILVCALCALVKRAAGGKRQRPHSPFGGKRREASASSCHVKSGKFQKWTQDGHGGYSYAMAWDCCITVSLFIGLPEPHMRDVEQATILRLFCVSNNVRTRDHPLGYYPGQPPSLKNKKEISNIYN